MSIRKWEIKMTYQQFVKKNLKIYIRSGMHPNDAMKAVGRDWREWKRSRNPQNWRDTMSVRDGRCAICGRSGSRKYFNGIKICKKCFLEHNRNPIYTVKGTVTQAPKLYTSFHGSEPMRARKVTLPEPKGKLIKIGRLVEIVYHPEYPSERRESHYVHKFGDTGTEKLKSNSILAADENGEIFIVKDKKGNGYPKFTDRGIVG